MNEYKPNVTDKLADLGFAVGKKVKLTNRITGMFKEYQDGIGKKPKEHRHDINKGTVSYVKGVWKNKVAISFALIMSSSLAHTNRS